MERKVTEAKTDKPETVERRREIVVLDRGWVYAGLVTNQGAESLLIEEAVNIRRWGTTRGLGELAAKGPQSATKTDPAGTVIAPMRAVIHRLLCQTSNW